MGKEYAQSEQLDNIGTQMEFILPKVLGVCIERVKWIDCIDEEDDKNGWMFVIL